MAKLYLDIKNQTLTVRCDIDRIVENSVNYLEYEINTTSDWDGLSTKVIIVQGANKPQEVYGGKIPSSMIRTPGIMISVIGYVVNADEQIEKMITTSPIFINIYPSGSIKGDTTGEEELKEATIKEQLNYQITDLRNYINEETAKINNNVAKTENDLREEIATINSNVTEINKKIATIDDNIAKTENDLREEIATINSNVMGALEKELQELKVTPEMTTFATGEYLLQDIEEDLMSVNRTEGVYIDPNTNTEHLDSNYCITDYIDVSEDDEIFASYRQSNILTFPAILFYDSNKKFISGVSPILNNEDELVNYKTHRGFYYTLPANVAYCRIEFPINRINYITALLKMSCKNVLQSVKIPLLEIPNDAPLKSKNIVNFGDSIFGNYRDTSENDKSISKMISEITGATCYNAGFGGCRMGIHSNYWDAFSMHSLADSINSGSWSIQEEALVNGSGTLPAYFTETVEMLKDIDWSTIDIITIGYGTNDYSGNVFIEETDAVFSNEWDYFKGALKYSIEKILKKYPHIQIVVITPMWRWFIENGEYFYDSDDSRSRNTRGYSLLDYVDACFEISTKLHVQCIDTYYNLGVNNVNYLNYFNSTDGTHPNLKGRKIRAEKIAAQIETKTSDNIPKKDAQTISNWQLAGAGYNNGWEKTQELSKADAVSCSGVYNHNSHTELPDAKYGIEIKDNYSKEFLKNLEDGDEILVQIDEEPFVLTVVQKNTYDNLESFVLMNAETSRGVIYHYSSTGLSYLEIIDNNKNMVGYHEVYLKRNILSASFYFSYYSDYDGNDSFCHLAQLTNPEWIKLFTEVSEDKQYFISIDKRPYLPAEIYKLDDPKSTVLFYREDILEAGYFLTGVGYYPGSVPMIGVQVNEDQSMIGFHTISIKTKS